MYRNCDICNCGHKYDVLTRTGILHMKGSEDDFICDRCRLEIVHFARSLQAVAGKVRWEEMERQKNV